ncbi:hypothetical protein A3Q56_05662 [Intoshia linei]|uniref:Retrotransposon gag domain-containing protein n=1 Tax=Intoshia linei TaxID=1819745 RepID=A0A177AX52_9BILA|nr:hypothetical protein A3Q56_05662 [Intoshia linei]
MGELEFGQPDILVFDNGEITANIEIWLNEFKNFVNLKWGSVCDDAKRMAVLKSYTSTFKKSTDIEAETKIWRNENILMNRQKFLKTFRGDESIQNFIDKLELNYKLFQYDCPGLKLDLLIKGCDDVVTQSNKPDHGAEYADMTMKHQFEIVPNSILILGLD